MPIVVGLFKSQRWLLLQTTGGETANHRLFPRTTYEARGCASEDLGEPQIFSLFFILPSGKLTC